MCDFCVPFSSLTLAYSSPYLFIFGSVCLSFSVFQPLCVKFSLLLICTLTYIGSLCIFQWFFFLIFAVHSHIDSLFLPSTDSAHTIRMHFDISFFHLPFFQNKKMMKNARLLTARRETCNEIRSQSNIRKISVLTNEWNAWLSIEQMTRRQLKTPENVQIAVCVLWFKFFNSSRTDIIQEICCLRRCTTCLHSLHSA